MNLTDAQVIAEKIKAELSPFCIKCEIAGSVRRERPEPNDIEIMNFGGGYNDRFRI